MFVIRTFNLSLGLLLEMSNMKKTTSCEYIGIVKLAP